MSGYLCGKCRGEKGVSALLKKCVSCGKASILLVILLGKLICFVYCNVHLRTSHSYSWCHCDNKHFSMLSINKTLVVPISLLSSGKYMWFTLSCSHQTILYIMHCINTINVQMPTWKYSKTIIMLISGCTISCSVLSCDIWCCSSICEYICILSTGMYSVCRMDKIQYVQFAY